MNGRASWVRYAALTATGIALCAAAPGRAAAVEVYWDPQVRIVPSQPLQLVVPSPVIYPRRYLIGVQPYSPPPVTVVRVTPPVPPTVVFDDGSREEPSRDPYQTGGLVIAGVGAGGLLFLGDGISQVVASYKLQLGLAVGQAEFGLRFDLVPEALPLQAPDGSSTEAALYTAGASFSYRFLPAATVHPVAGFGLEGIFLDPHQGETGTAFAVTARAGLELAYPLADGALALGIDVTGHHPFGATETYAANMVDMISFGAYGNYRF